MRRLNIKKVEDTRKLSVIFDELLKVLAAEPFLVTQKALAYNTDIEESIFRRMRNLHNNPDDTPNIFASDFRIMFANVLFRYPTIRIWETRSGELFFEM